MAAEVEAPLSTVTVERTCTGGLAGRGVVQTSVGAHRVDSGSGNQKAAWRCLSII